MEDSKNEKPAIAAAWAKIADPCANAALWSLTRAAGGVWRRALSARKPGNNPVI